MDNILPLKTDFSGQDLKQKLLDCLDAQGAEFSDIARDYFNKTTLSKEDRVGLLTAVINAIDHVLSADDWNQSLFLRNTLKPLLQIKAEAESELVQLTSKPSDRFAGIKPAADDELEVYVSLFQSDGYNIGKWAMQLRSLDRYVVGRPIYQSMADIESRIRLRGGSGNEACAVVVVKKTDLQVDAAGPLKDQFDHTLLSLKETALRSGRIIAFVHQGNRYHFVDGQLIKS